MVKKFRYEASGCRAIQCQVSKSASVAASADSRAPTLIASMPAGTRTEMSISAGSDGWSLAGNHQAELSGSLATVHSSLVVDQARTSPCRMSPGFPA